MPEYVLAIDQGTTSTRVMVCNRAGSVLAAAAREHRQLFPRPGWVEHDAVEIWQNTRDLLGQALATAELSRHDIAAIGITNQRETTVLWDAQTGQPVAPAIVWQDTRTQPLVADLAREGGVDRFSDRTGLPLATYFSATKVRWLLDTVPGARAASEAGRLRCGTIDAWLLWNLTGGTAGGVHATDVTNASRTQLLNIYSGEWDASLLAAFDIPAALLPAVRPSMGEFGIVQEEVLRGVPILGVLGDQQAAMFGQAAFDPGDAKNTYGTGNFLMVQSGTTPVRSRNGLLTTIAYRIGDGPLHYALEGSIAVTGSLVQWLRDNLGFIEQAADIEALAASVSDAGGAVIVPAFSGLFAPYWRPDARGVIAGLTRFITRAHLARAALESIAFQTRDVLDAVVADTGSAMRELRVDGGATANALLMQVQADVLGIDVVRPAIAETTALGAAYAAGLGAGLWSSVEEIRSQWAEGQRWTATSSPEDRDRMLAGWRKAVTRTFDWANPDSSAENETG